MTRLWILLISLLVISGCASMKADYVVEVDDPNKEVERLLGRYYQLFESGASCHNDTSGTSFQDCEGMLRRVSQLYTAFPDNERVKMTAALMSYQAGKRGQAAFLLDQLLADERPRPEAAALRARIALEEGNTGRARNLLISQLRQNPMHSTLHEVRAAVYFMDMDYAGAFKSLALSERLGGPPWRIAYHRGLLFEKQGNIAAACEQYADAYRRNPSFAAPEGRLLALADNMVCFDLSRFVRG